VAGPGPLVIDAVTPTAPTGLSVTVASALSAITSRIGQVDVCEFPTKRAICLSNGVDFQYHLIDGAQYLTGPRAPYTAPTLVSTGVRATAVLTFTGASNALARPTDGDTFTVGDPSLFTAVRSGTFKTTLTLGALVNEVLIGANVDATISNLTKFINGTGVNGVDYWLAPISASSYSASYWQDVVGVEVSTSQAYGVPSATTATITFRAVQYGTVGNTYTSAEVGGQTSFAGATFSGGTGGTGTTPADGYFRYGYAWVRLGDSAQTGLSNTTDLDTGLAANNTATIADTSPTRDDTDLIRLFRTTDEGSEMYRVVDDATSPVTDDQSDTELVRDANIIFEPDAVRYYDSGYPTRYRFHATHLGSVWGIGAYPAAKFDGGTASVTVDSLTVTLSAATFPTVRMIGRVFRVDDIDDRYLIVDVDEAARTLTLNRPYEGATNATAGYEIIDERDPFTPYYSVPLLLNNWPAENDLAGSIFSDDPRGGTALRSIEDSLIIWTMTGLWRVIGTPDTSFRALPQGDGCGTYNNRCVLKVGEGKFAWLGPDGLYAWSGAGDPSPISHPDTGEAVDDPTGISGTLKRINPLAVDGIVATYNPTLDVARWAVPVDGCPWNNLVIQLNLQTMTFTTRECDAWTMLETVVGPDGDYVTVAGSMQGRLWQLDIGYSDGAYGFPCVQTVASYAAATRLVTVTGTPFTVDGANDCPVLLVSTDGSIERALVADTSTSELILAHPPATSPAAGWQVVVGGILLALDTSDFNQGEVTARKTLSSLAVHFKKSTAGQLWCAAAYDEGSPTLFTLLDGTSDHADLTSTDGIYRFDLRMGPGRTNRIRLFALAPGFDVTIVGIEATFRLRKEYER
jgi:hypothetical protein